MHPSSYPTNKIKELYNKLLVIKNCVAKLFRQAAYMLILSQRITMLFQVWHTTAHDTGIMQISDGQFYGMFTKPLYFL
jgi:hypothetical protein